MRNAQVIIRPLFLALVLNCPSFAADSTTKAVDVVVVGATPGGIAATVAAARLGRTVALVEYEDHVGGIVSNGLTNSDINNHQAVGGLFYEFTRRVLKYYQSLDGQGEKPGPNVKLCRDGYWYEADVAERIFLEMLSGQQPRVQLLLKHRLQKAIVEESTLRAIVIEDLGNPGRLTTLTAGAFIDATYEGDLAALAGAPCRVGRESREEYGEPHAGRVYAKFGTTDLLPGSTGEADAAIEGFCFRFHATKDADNRVPITRPDNYRRSDYEALLADIRSGRITRLQQAVQFYPMPRGHFELNSDHPHPDTGVPSESLDLAEENWGWPEATPEERQRLYRRYLSHNVGLLWTLQNDPEVPEAIRREASPWGWCRDLWPSNGHLPRQVYVRQGRRILGEYVLTERDGEVDAAITRTRVQPTSIGIVEFAFDSHGTRKFDPAHPGVREGYIYINHPPIQVPLGVLVPRKIDGLLVPVACSASHVGYNALRMEPVFMAFGEAAGTAAHVALESKVPIRRVPVGKVQQILVARGAVITHYDDLPFNHPAFAALQWLGARGLNPGYEATPDRLLTRGDGWKKLSRMLKAMQKPWNPPSDSPDALLRRSDVFQWLAQAGVAVKAGDGADERGSLTVSQFAAVVYQALCAVRFDGLDTP